MKAIIVEKYGNPSQLKLTDAPIPTPLDNEVQIAIHYTSVNPVDWKIAEGHFDMYPHEFPFILGWDAAGKISKVGKNVRDFKIGDEVYCYARKPLLKWGTYCEYVCMEAEHVALKPKNISFAQAAAIPLVGLTAWQAFFDVGKLKKGEKVLIHAGAGGVGTMAIQLAKHQGAYVITTASQKNSAYVKKLGADLVIDYTKEKFQDRILQQFPVGIDTVLDTVGGKTLPENYAVLKPRGKLLSIVAPLKENPPKEIEYHHIFVRPSGPQLKQIAALIEQGKIVPPKIEEMRLEEAPAALEKNRAGHVSGKIVLSVRAA